MVKRFLKILLPFLQQPCFALFTPFIPQMSFGTTVSGRLSHPDVSKEEFIFFFLQVFPQTFFDGLLCFTINMQGFSVLSIFLVWK